MRRGNWTRVGSEKHLHPTAPTYLIYKAILREQNEVCSPFGKLPSHALFPPPHLPTTETRCQRASPEPWKVVMKFVSCSHALIASKPKWFHEFHVGTLLCFPFLFSGVQRISQTPVCIFHLFLYRHTRRRVSGSPWQWLRGTKELLGAEHIHVKICKAASLNETCTRSCFMYVKLNISSLKVYRFIHVPEYIKSHIQCSSIGKLKHKCAMTWLNLPFKFAVNGVNDDTNH